MIRVIALLALLAATPAIAQQQPDTAMLQKALAVLQGQRNQAMDVLASTEVQRATLAEENEKLKAEIVELKKKTKAPAD